ncbi:MAG: GNAT family N-acetyltransferase [Candidatus Bathyarchaeota archaeon]|nr:MAG: GNAT family N-acetyltransferase [Candidatus Bathyarchaeota archaeon]
MKPKNRINLRDKTEEDYDFIYNILRENMLERYIKHWGGWSDEEFNKGYGRGIVKIVEQEGEKIGFLHYEILSDHLYILNIQLKSSVQGRGIGTFLMKVLEKETKKNALSKIRLLVFKDNPALKFYKSLGYIKEIENREASLVLEKII